MCQCVARKRRFAFRNGSFCLLKRAVLDCKTGRLGKGAVEWPSSFCHYCIKQLAELKTNEAKSYALLKSNMDILSAVTEIFVYGF